ncbi:MAG: copper transport protein [Verrucomicrobiales bacterium]|jgi:copper transport protein
MRLSASNLVGIHALRGGVALVVILVFSAVLAGPAYGHTGFESSTPSDGQLLDAPVSDLTITFSGLAEPAGDGFVIFDSSGDIRTPDSVTSDDDLTWRLGFDAPLTTGTIGVRWRVAAPDAHPIEGSFSFTVDTPAATITTAAVASNTEALAPTTTSSTLSAINPSEPFTDETARAFEEFLDTDDSEAPLSGTLGVIGRILTLLGAMIGLGGLVFGAAVLRGDPSDIRSVLFWTRRASVLLGVGVLIELLAQIASTGGTWASFASPGAIESVVVSSFGAAVGLRLLGAIVLGFGARLDVRVASASITPRAVIEEHAMVGARPAGGGVLLKGRPERERDEDRPVDDGQVWQAATGMVAFTGAALVLASFLFDGHTASEGPRLVHALANVAHVGAGATWAGGVLMLAHVVSRRHRRGADLRAVELAIRFSVIAAVALVVAGIAGTIVAVVILDSVSELWSTPWGRLLLAKVIAVGVAASAGAYNHKVLIPLMNRSEGDGSASQHFRSVVRGEAIALIVVIALTAILVGAAS